MALPPAEAPLYETKWEMYGVRKPLTALAPESNHPEACQDRGNGFATRVPSQADSCRCFFFMLRAERTPPLKKIPYMPQLPNSWNGALPKYKREVRFPKR